VTASRPILLLVRTFSFHFRKRRIRQARNIFIFIFLAWAWNNYWQERRAMESVVVHTALAVDKIIEQRELDDFFHKH